MEDKRAPVQGWAAGIPWAMHLEAYSAYCKRYGPQKALIEGGCRGGFHTNELDVFLPGWREKVSALKIAEARIRALEIEIDELQRLPQPLKGFVPQTYGDAIIAGWIKHGDCLSYEWDNRTSSANARWMIERLLFKEKEST